MNEKQLLTYYMIELLESIKRKHGQNAIVHIRADDGGVTIYDVVTNKMLYDADTLVEFTYRFSADNQA